MGERQLNIFSRFITKAQMVQHRFSVPSAKWNRKQGEDTVMKHVTRTILLITMTFLATASMAQVEDEPRQSLTSQGSDIARGSVGEGSTSYDEFEALKIEGTRSGKSSHSTTQKMGAAVSQAADPNFWFYDVDVQLFSDFDNDGYYFGIDLWFDADTNYAVADVFAVIYLSYEYGPWNEYAETEDFTLFGTASSDDYIVETELVSGYPTGDYDILIELFDAYDGSFLASFGPENTSELALLPLEDSTRDARSGGQTQVVVNSGGGGATGLLFLLGLLAVRMTLRPQAARPSK